MSDKIHLRQGVPQGDVISAYIFILMVELLLLKINYTKHLTGIVFAKVEARSETFADDTTIFLECTANNLRYATKFITAFHKISGLSCNLDKTVVIPIGLNTDKNNISGINLGIKIGTKEKILSTAFLHYLRQTRLVDRKTGRVPSINLLL